MVRKFVLPVIAISGLLLMAFAAPAGAQGKEQVVFSGEGTGTFEAEFWIWCAVDEAGNYDDCNGAIRFDDLHLVRHVDGEVAETGEDVYQMDVSSSDGAVACTLTNVPPITHGHTNTVMIDCSSPSGSATSDDAVVVATG
jgi:hypothetical protein